MVFSARPTPSANLSLEPAAAPAPAVQPNIVFILADDLGWSDTGFLGAKLIATSPAVTGQKPHKLNTHTKPSHRTEWLPVTAPALHAIGYFNDTQNRHKPDTHLLREESVKPGLTDWANILCLEPIGST